MAFKWDQGTRLEIRRGLQHINDQIVPAASEVVVEQAEVILAQSQPLVPVKTGNLQSTGEAHLSRIGARTGATAQVSYGGRGQADYAVYIHEGLHLNHPNGGQAKYLQQPLLEALNWLGQAFAAGLAVRIRP